MVTLNYERGKPELFLQPLENTVLEIPTQEDYDMVMMVLQAGRWRHEGIHNTPLPTKVNLWEELQEDTCVELKYRFESDHAWYAAEKGRNFMFLPQFYEMNGVTKDNKNELKAWFDQYFPNRASKG